MYSVLRPEIFEIKDTEKWMKNLEEEGYVVISDILTESEMKKGMEIFIKDMKEISPNFNISKPGEMNIDNCPVMYGKGMAVFNGWGQSDFMWHIRTNSNILSIFKTIYKSDDLVVSLDGFSMFVSKDQKSKPWLHYDQNPKNNIYSIQGAYNYLPVSSSEDAGFVLVPKSHNLVKPEVKHSKDWIVCEEQPVKETVKLLIPANCLVLWNSKTIHANHGMGKKERGLNRLTCYITYQPKKLRNEKTKQNRIKAYLEAETTSHWATKCELKRYPFGFKKRYEERGFKRLKPLLENDEIPEERLSLL